MASPPCGPGREDGGDVGALRTDRRTGCWQSEVDFSRQGRHSSVPTERRTVPPRKPGIRLHDRAGSQPRDFLRRPFQMRTARLLPSASLTSGSASSSAHASAGPRGVLAVAGSPGPGDASGRMPPPAARRAQIPRDTGQHLSGAQWSPSA